MTPNTGARSSAPSSSDRERQLERVAALADGDHLVADVAPSARQRALGERLAAERRERLRRAEPLRRAADEQHAGRG